MAELGIEELSRNYISQQLKRPVKAETLKLEGPLETNLLVVGIDCIYAKNM